MLALVGFIKEKTEAFLNKETLARISFDLTNIKTLSGGFGDGMFVIFELKLVSGKDLLFKKTSFYEDGQYLNWKWEHLRKHITEILAGK